MLLTNNYCRRQIILSGQGESYTRTTISPGYGLSSFLPIQNDRKIFLSTENIILKPISTESNIKSLFCLYNDSDEEIIYEWKEYDFIFYLIYLGRWSNDSSTIICILYTDNNNKNVKC